MKDCGSDFLIIYSHLTPPQPHPGFVSAWMLEGHQASGSVFPLESARGIFCRMEKFSQVRQRGCARVNENMCVNSTLSLTAPGSSLLPSTGARFPPILPFSLSLSSLILHCLTILCTARELALFFPPSTCTCASEILPVADL